ncbi:MAG: radical SAM protein [Anaerolineaceae bacterium]|nr:radical SAM protein [Anaerolineaceae bacterium]
MPILDQKSPGNASPGVNQSSRHEIFALPVMDKVLIYAPLQGLVALVDQLAADQLRKGIAGDEPIENAKLKALIADLQTPQDIPQPRQGGMGAPLFLGLVTTRGCNMGCKYCDFAAPKQTSPIMDLSTARRAIDAYFHVLSQQGISHAELHFFGGEPFFAPQTVHFSVEYALAKASENHKTLHLEAITNGFFNPRMADWVAKTFDTVFLSLDGPREIHDLYRPTISGRSTFATITRNARLFLDQNVELILRSCVTSDTVGRLPEIAAWFADELHPSAVCFEAMVSSALSQSQGIAPPDPWNFARSFCQAADILAAQGIRTVLSTAELCIPYVSFCPVGNDAMIVTPEGKINACYLLEEDWRKEGLDLQYGSLGEENNPPGSFILDQNGLDRIRQFNVHSYPLCADCFCRFHCSGGCHVNHRKTLHSSTYDSTCIQTRMITISILLKRMGQAALSQQWLSEMDHYRSTVLQKDDRL